MTPIVLVVEEQPALRRSYERFLREEGYRVLVAPPTEEALRLVRENPPDLIVIDPTAGAGLGRWIADEALRIDPTVRLIFNTCDPMDLELDFSSWMADAFTRRSPRLEEMGEAVHALLDRALRVKRSPGHARA
jgi:DNA-binding response OmpR family regulator